MFLCSHCLPYTHLAHLHRLPVCRHVSIQCLSAHALQTCVHIPLCSHSIPHLCPGDPACATCSEWRACSPQRSPCWPRLRGELSNAHSYNSAQGCGHSTLPPPQSLPEKQKRARHVGGGQSPRHNRTSDVRSALPRVSPTSSQPCPTHPPPTPQPQHPWPVNGSACLYSQETVSGSGPPPTSSPAPSNRGS